MNSEAGRESETTHAKGVVERSVETADYRTSAGQGQEQRRVEVIHETHGSTTSGGALAGAAAAAATALQSAKNALSGK